MRNGETVAAFEREFADFVGARYAIALCNGTATLHTALVALGVKPGDRVAVPPLTMSATTLAVLHAGAVPQFVDVDARTWLTLGALDDEVMVPVSLYGLHAPMYGGYVVDDAAQTLRPHGHADFTSYSFQASKILALGEGGMLVTDDEGLATKAREFSSLGYRMRPNQPRIDPAVLKSPTYERHYSVGFNFRMNDLTAAEGLRQLDRAEWLISRRLSCAEMYANAVEGCEWITPQHVPEGWQHDMWAYAVALDSAERWAPFADAIVRHGGERPYAAWQLTYREPAFRHLIARERGYVAVHTIGRREPETYFTEPPLSCPVAESLQPRLVQFQTNNLDAAERNARAVRLAIQEIG